MFLKRFALITKSNKKMKWQSVLKSQRASIPCYGRLEEHLDEDRNVLETINYGKLFSAKDGRCNAADFCLLYRHWRYVSVKLFCNRGFILSTPVLFLIGFVRRWLVVDSLIVCLMLFSKLERRGFWMVGAKQLQRY